MIIVDEQRYSTKNRIENRIYHDRTPMSSLAQHAQSLGPCTQTKPEHNEKTATDAYMIAEQPRPTDDRL